MKELKKEFEKTIKNKVKPIDEKIKKLETSFKNSDKAIKKQGETLTDILEIVSNKKDANLENQLDAFLEKNIDKIKQIYKNKNGVIEFVEKAPAAISTANGNVVNNPNIPNDMRLGHFNLMDYSFVEGLVNSFDTNQASFPYTEMKPKEGDFEFVNEGAVKPMLDFTWEQRYAEPKKAAAYEILSEESVKDVKMLKSLAKEYLRKKHNIFKAKAIINYAISIARTFNAGPLATQIENANFMDVVNSIATDIATAQAYQDQNQYIPNVVLVSTTDFLINFASAKDANGLPLYPSASLFNKVAIGNMLIIPSLLIPVGKVFVADMSLVNVTRYEPYTVRIGWINETFIHNQFVMLGESRYHLFVKEQDKGAFVFDDYSVVKQAILKP